MKLYIKLIIQAMIALVEKQESEAELWQHSSAVCPMSDAVQVQKLQEALRTIHGSVRGMRKQMMRM